MLKKYYSQSMSQEEVEKIKKLAEPILREAGATRAEIFGSQSRGEAGKTSDIDILVELPGQGGLLDFVRLKNKLEDALQKAVDLVEYDSIKPSLKAYILADRTQII